MKKNEQPKKCYVCGENCVYQHVISATQNEEGWYCKKCKGYPATMDGKPIILNYSMQPFSQ